MKVKKIMAIILCTVMVFSTVLTVSANGIGVTAVKIIDTKDGPTVAAHFNDILNKIIAEYKYDITKEELLQSAVSEFLTAHPEYLAEFGKGAVAALDEHSNFYTKEEYTAVKEDVSGNYVGIGIYVSQEGTKIVLGEPIEGSPAENSGLRVGDIIKAVDGVDVTEFALDRVTSLIKGEPGTDVDITVLRNGIEYTYTLTRAEIKLNPITYSIIEDKNIGYVKISSFNANTSLEFMRAALEFYKKGITKIILDVRNNRGGYLEEALIIASFFVPDGKLIVTEEHKNPDENFSYYAAETPCKFKAVVLINEHSASASELVASAIRDYNAGVLVGKRSYGKGSMQQSQTLGSLNHLWMTIAEYYTPSHTPIHNVGLKPDYIVANTTKKFDMSTLTTYDTSRVYKLGDVDANVASLKERFRLLGYNLPLDDVYDINTADAVKDFQTVTGLFPYRVADITTQMKLNDVLADSDVEVDNQYEKAVEIAEKLK